MKKKNKLSGFKIFLIFIITLLILSQVPYYLREIQINSITLGESRRSDIENTFGPPLQLVHQKEGVVCDDYNVQKFLNSTAYWFQIGRGISGCLEMYPQSKSIKRCFYNANPSIIRLKFEEDMELYYNEDDVVCNLQRFSLP